MSHSNIELVGVIDDLLTKVAAESGGKKAEANTEAGGYQGSTTHPVKDVDDRTEDAQEGARSAENHSDVKADQGAPGVDSTAEGTPGGQDSVQMSVGVTSKATGEDSSVEQDYKPGKDDGNTTHPADTENDQLDGMKYSADFRALQKLAASVEKAGSDLLAAIATEANGDAQKQAQAMQKAKEAEHKPEAKESKEAEQKQEPKESKEAEQKRQQGFDLAGIFANVDVPTEDKMAADRMVVETIDQILQLADSRALKCAHFYYGQAEAAKKAEEEGDGGEKEKSDFPEGGSDNGEDDAAAAEESSGGEGPPMAEGAGDGAGMGGSEDEILALLNGGEGMGAEEAMGGMGPDAGGAPDLSALGGGGAPGPMAGGGAPDPMAGGGAPDSMAGGGAPDSMAGGGAPDPMAGGGGMDDAAALEAALAQLGISLEDLQMMLANKAASALQARIQDRVRGGEKQSGAPKPKTAADKQRVAAMVQTVQEIIGRGS